MVLLELLSFSLRLGSVWVVPAELLISLIVVTGEEFVALLLVAVFNRERTSGFCNDGFDIRLTRAGRPDAALLVNTELAGARHCAEAVPFVVVTTVAPTVAL